MSQTTVGIVTIQGDFEKHVKSLRALDPGMDIRGLKTPEDLQGVDRVIIPGGESTTVGMLMQRFGLGDALIERVRAGMPIWGTCMGLILLANEIEGHEQYSLSLLDVTVRRNAFGAQVHSFEDSVDFEGLPEPVLGVYIRAPIITRLGDGVQALSHYDGKCVAARQGHVIGTSFHPELTDDTRLHAWFLGL
ncbi:MAG: pyridoxal 5'-phosphate synthase glutaminase subunit PdxT [Chthonomonas sp.]|nr:pyridoxal 5'-phosphate synthase glutaminase subunit PdxT [Chthonomonas sp.]